MDKGEVGTEDVGTGKLVGGFGVDVNSERESPSILSRLCAEQFDFAREGGGQFILANDIGLKTNVSASSMRI